MAKSFQYDHAGLGERYQTKPLYGIVEATKIPSSDCGRAVHRLAEHIIEVGDQSIAYADDDISGRGAERF